MLWLALLVVVLLFLIPLPQRKRSRPYNTTNYVGSKTNLRLVGGKVYDAAGNEVKTRPLSELLDKKN